MKNLTVLCLIILQLQCKFFKVSDLDTNGPIANALLLLRLISLSDALFSQSNTIAFFTFKNSSGLPCSACEVRYSVFNEEDERGTKTSTLGESGNVVEYKSLLDSDGRAFLTFSERGYATLDVYIDSSSTTSLGTFRFRNYAGLTYENFSFVSATGEINATLEDLSNYRNRFASYYSFDSLGSANGRQYIYFQVVRTFDPSANISIHDGYIASSSDGLNYDQVTKLENVTISFDAVNKTEIKVSKPGFDGNQIVFFIGEVTASLGGVFISGKNLVLRFPVGTQPMNATPESLSLPADYFLFAGTVSSPIFPVLSLGNRWLLAPYYIPDSVNYPMVISLDGSFSQNINSAPFNCNLGVNSEFADTFQIYESSGTKYLQCPDSGSALGGANLGMKSFRTLDLVANTITYNAGSFTFESPPVVAETKQIVSIANGPNVSLYLVQTANYTNALPTLSLGSEIPNTTNLNFAGFPDLRFVLNSGGVETAVMASNPTFNVAMNINLFKSTDGFSSVSVLPTIPSNYPVSWTNPQQIQSKNGLVNINWASSQSVTRGSSVGSLPIYLQQSTDTSGNWQSVPKLLRIK